MGDLQWDQVEDAAHQLLLRRLADRDATTMAMLAEVIVAGVLPGSTVSAGTYDRGSDVDWNGHAIEVKASGRRPPSWKLRPNSRAVAEVYAFADYSTSERLDGWRWWVAPTELVVANTFWSPASLAAAGLAPVDTAGLARAVGDACRQAQTGPVVTWTTTKNGAGPRNLDDDALDDLVRSMLDRGFRNANQIAAEIRGTPNGTNDRRLRASIARVRAQMEP